MRSDLTTPMVGPTGRRCPGEGDREMFGTTGDLMNTIMASRIAEERVATATAHSARHAPAPRRVAVRSALTSGWDRVRTLVATVIA